MSIKYERLRVEIEGLSSGPFDVNETITSYDGDILRTETKEHRFANFQAVVTYLGRSKEKAV